MAKVLMLLPASGDDHYEGFKSSAVSLREKVFGPANCMIFSCEIDSSDRATFSPAMTPPRGLSKDFWTCVAAVDTFMTISHCGVIDGPVMKHGPTRQPWMVRPGQRTVLQNRGYNFWDRIGRGGVNRIIIAGCSSGETYSQAVANAANVVVYGYMQSMACGINTVMVQSIGALEKGHRPNNMTKAKRIVDVGPTIHPNLYRSYSADDEEDAEAPVPNPQDDELPIF